MVLTVPVFSPLLHGVGGGGIWDEVIMLGLIGGLMALLLVMSIMSARRRRSHRVKKSRRS